MQIRHYIQSKDPSFINNSYCLNRTEILDINKNYQKRFKIDIQKECRFVDNIYSYYLAICLYKQEYHYITNISIFVVIVGMKKIIDLWSVANKMQKIQQIKCLNNENIGQLIFGRNWTTNKQNNYQLMINIAKKCLKSQKIQQIFKQISKKQYIKALKILEQWLLKHCPEYKNRIRIINHLSIRQQFVKYKYLQMLSYNIDQYVFQSQLPQRITIQHNKIKQYYPIQYINQEHVNYFICDQIYKGYYQIQNNYNKICRRLPKELIKKPKNKPNKFSQILQQQQYHEAIANYLENKIEYHLDFNQVMGILTNQNYQDLRQYFMQDITEQILQYYAISHKQYPCLTPKNIKYNTRTQIFKLDIQPIIQQLSGIDHHQLPYKLYPSKKNIFIPQQTQFNQLYEQRLKIMQQYLYFSNDNSNLSQFLMLLHYFDCIYLYKKQTTDHIGENYLKMYLRKQFDINSSPLSQRRLSQSILSQNMNIIKNKLSDKHKNHNNEYNSFIEIDYNNKNRSLITDQLSISDQHFSLKITITKKIFELWLRIKDFSNKNTKQENLWSIILNLLNLYKLIIKCELFIYCQKQKRKLCIIRQIKDIYKIEAKNVLRKQSHKNILRSVVEYAQYLCDRYAKYYGKNVCYYRKYAGTDFIGHQNKILLQIQSQINNLKVQYIQNINYKKYLQIYCDLLMCVRNLKIQNIQYVQYQILSILDKSLKITTKQQYIYQKITQIQAFIQTFKQ